MPRCKLLPPCASASVLLAASAVLGEPVRATEPRASVVLTQRALEAARELFEEGKAALVAEDAERAVAAFRSAFALAPLPTVCLALARALEKDGQLGEALRYHELAPTLPWPEELDAAPQRESQRLARLEGLSLKARLALAANRHAEAVTYLERAFAIESLPTVGLELAQALEAAGALNLAVERYERLAAQPLPQGLAVHQRREQANAVRTAEVKAAWLKEKITFEQARHLALHEALLQKSLLQKSLQQKSLPDDESAPAKPAHRDAEPSELARHLAWAAVGVGSTAVLFNFVTWLHFGAPMPWEEASCRADDCGGENTWRRAMSVAGFAGLALGLAGGGLLLYESMNGQRSADAETSVELSLGVGLGSLSLSGCL